MPKGGEKRNYHVDRQRSLGSGRNSARPTLRSLSYARALDPWCVSQPRIHQQVRGCARTHASRKGNLPMMRVRPNRARSRRDDRELETVLAASTVEWPTGKASSSVELDRVRLNVFSGLGDLRQSRQVSFGIGYETKTVFAAQRAPSCKVAGKISGVYWSASGFSSFSAFSGGTRGA
jgi:hypothetical protein